MKRVLWMFRKEAKLLTIYFTPEFMSLRLISDTSSETCAGRLEVFYSGAWGSVGKSDMSATTVGVVCRGLPWVPF